MLMHGGRGLDFRFGSTQPKAVVAATYGSRKSRIVLWDTSTDEFELGQWVGRRMWILDLSPDAEYLASYIYSPQSTVQAYVTISRPPYLTALAFLPVHSIYRCDGAFDQNGNFVLHAMPMGEARVNEGCPFKIRLTESPEEPEQIFRERTGRWLRVWEALDLFPAMERFMGQDSLIGTDQNDRVILSSNFRLFAFSDEQPEGVLLLDLADGTFQEMATPAWAREWTAERPKHER